MTGTFGVHIRTEFIVIAMAACLLSVVSLQEMDHAEYWRPHAPFGRKLLDDDHRGCSVDADCNRGACGYCNTGDCDDHYANGRVCSVGSATGTCLDGDCVNLVANDPALGGFDGKTFHFDEIGEFTLLEEGEGWKVEVTFSAAPTTIEGVGEVRESSWTTAVRVYNTQGDMVSCSIPAVYPNASLAQDLSWKEYAGVQYSTVVGCKVATPPMDIHIYQVSGWEEAKAKPEEHGWAAPFTWLNLYFVLHKELTAPVTGIMGDTYPKVGQQDGSQTAGSSGPGKGAVATAVGEVGAGAGRTLQIIPSHTLPLAFSVVGLQV